LDLFRLDRFSVSRLLGYLVERRLRWLSGVEARSRSRSIFSVGGHTDDTDLAETRGFFNCVENFRINTDLMAAARPFRLLGKYRQFVKFDE
jgi:hypothetical protein